MSQEREDDAQIKIVRSIFRGEEDDQSFSCSITVTVAWLLISCQIVSHILTIYFMFPLVAGAGLVLGARICVVDLEL